MEYMELIAEILKFIAICLWSFWTIQITNRVSALRAALQCQEQFDTITLNKVKELEDKVNELENDLKKIEENLDET